MHRTELILLLIPSVACGLSSEFKNACEKTNTFVASPEFANIAAPDKPMLLGKFLNNHFSSSSGQRMMGALAVATPQQRYMLMQAAAKEAGVSDWQCPVFEDLWTPPPKDEVSALCARFEETYSTLDKSKMDSELKSFFNRALYRSLKSNELTAPMTLKADARYAAIQKHARKYQSDWSCTAMEKAFNPPVDEKPLLPGENVRLCTAEGKLSRAAFVGFVKARLSRRVRFCYERALMKSPRLGGKIVAKWTSSKAKVKNISLTTNELTPAVGSCIKKIIASINVPLEGNDCEYTVSYPFIFTAK